MSYFVDDENSVNLFLGYAVAGERLKRQLEEQGIQVDRRHPLFVYLPCGMAGRRAVAYGLKENIRRLCSLLFHGADPGLLYAGGMATESMTRSASGLRYQRKRRRRRTCRGRSAFVGKVIEKTACRNLHLSRIESCTTDAFSKDRGYIYRTICKVLQWC